MSDAAKKLFEDLTALGKVLFQWVEDHLDPEIKARVLKRLKEENGFNSISDTLCQNKTMMRILQYPAYNESEVPVGAVRAAAHEDINAITILPIGSARGLQVQPRWGKAKKKGSNETYDHWVEVPVGSQAIVVNVGDMLQELTGGDFISTTHRVVKLEDVSTDRMSVPCFLHHHAHTALSDRYTG